MRLLDNLQVEWKRGMSILESSPSGKSGYGRARILGYAILQLLPASCFPDAPLDSLIFPEKFKKLGFEVFDVDFLNTEFQDYIPDIYDFEDDDAFEMYLENSDKVRLGDLVGNDLESTFEKILVDYPGIPSYISTGYHYMYILYSPRLNNFIRAVLENERAFSSEEYSDFLSFLRGTGVYGSQDFFSEFVERTSIGIDGPYFGKEGVFIPFYNEGDLDDAFRCAGELEYLLYLYLYLINKGMDYIVHTFNLDLGRCFNERIVEDKKGIYLDVSFR